MPPGIVNSLQEFVIGSHSEKKLHISQDTHDPGKFRNNYVGVSENSAPLNPVAHHHFPLKMAILCVAQSVYIYILYLVGSLELFLFSIIYGIILSID